MPEGLTKEDLDKQNELIKELRETVEQKDGETAEAKQKANRIEKELDKIEEKNQEFTQKLQQEEKEKQEIKEQVEALEAKLSRMPAEGGADQEQQEAKMRLKAFEAAAQKGLERMSHDSEELKYLRTDVNTDGGVLAPPEYVTDILKQITEVSPVRQVARIRNTSRSEIQIPKRTGKPKGGFRGEGGQLPTDHSSYGMITIRAHNLDVIVEVTTNMLTDSAFNMETEINQDVVEDFAEIEGDKFLNGTGVEEPEGILLNSDIADVNSGISNDIDADNFFDLQGQLKTGYNGAFMFNRRTLARIRKLKDNDGQYLFTPASQGAPNLIAGDPYFLGNDMPDVSNGELPVVYGDWARGYTIADNTDMTMLRDPYSLAGSGKVRFIFSRRVGGKVTLAEAFKRLNIAT